MTEHHAPYLSPEIAAAEVDRVRRDVRRRARWPGWTWLAIAVVICGFFLATGSGNRLVAELVGPLPIVVAAVIYLLALRQPVIGRSEVGRIDKPVSYVFLAAVAAGTIIKLTVLPDGFSAWLVIVAVLVAVPCLFGSWRWLRS